MTRRWAKVQFQEEGYHCYPNAPDGVKFLENLHRHVFHITVWIEQFHDNRDVEYILFLRFLRDSWSKSSWAVSSSCEHMAGVLVNKIQHKYPDRHIKIEVTEDGENGALLEVTALEAYHR